MPHVNMAAHEWRTGEFELLVRLYENHPCLYDTTNKDYKNKNKRMGAFSDNNCSGTQSDILFLIHFLFLCKEHYALKVG